MSASLTTGRVKPAHEPPTNSRLVLATNGDVHHVALYYKRSEDDPYAHWVDAHSNEPLEDVTAWQELNQAEPEEIPEYLTTLEALSLVAWYENTSGLSPGILARPCRDGLLNTRRRVLYALLRHLAGPDWTLLRIASVFRRDHGAVLKSLRKVTPDQMDHAANILARWRKQNPK